MKFAQNSVAHLQGTQEAKMKIGERFSPLWVGWVGEKLKCVVLIIYVGLESSQRNLLGSGTNEERSRCLE